MSIHTQDTLVFILEVAYHVFVLHNKVNPLLCGYFLQYIYRSKTPFAHFKLNQGALHTPDNNGSHRSLK